MPKCRQSLGQVGELVEHRAQVAGDLIVRIGSAEERLALFEMSVAKRLDSTQRTDKVSLRGLFSDRKQRVRRASKCGDDDNRVAGQPALDDLGCSLDRRRVTDRGAAE